MENRLCLNKKKVYELPDEVIVDEYTRYNKTPNFEPDICLSNMGRTLRVRKKDETFKQIWVKTNNIDLIDFIKKYDFTKCCNSSTSSRVYLEVWKFKKIILEEFYGVKDGK